MKKGKEPPKIFLNDKELKAIVMSLQYTNDFASDWNKRDNVPWNPEGRAILKDITDTTQGILRKLSNAYNDGKPFPPLPPFVDGDEDEFLTKES